MEEIVSNKIFGVHPVLEALQSGKPFEKIMIKEGEGMESIRSILYTAKEKNIPIQRVPIERLNRLAKGNHQGVVAFLSAAKYADLETIMEDLKKKNETPFIILLDQVTDVRNFGAIARTAECAGAHAIVVPAKGAAPLSDDAMKTSAGALNHIPVCKVPNLKTAIYMMKTYDVNIIAASEKAENDYYDCDFTKGSAILLGSENQGISQSNLDLVDSTVKIPVKGKISSLNVSVAASIIMYECIRQRNNL